MTFLSLGNNYQVSLKDVFAANRQKVLLKLDNPNSVVFLKGGAAEERYDSDHEPIFRQESYFWWLTGVKDPDCAVCIHNQGTTTATTLFIPRLPQSYATIMGHIKTTDEWKELYQVDHVEYTDQMEQYLWDLLQSKGSDNGNEQKLLLMKGPNSDSGNMYEPPTFSNNKLEEFIDTSTLFPALAEARVIKSPAELLLLRHVTEVTSFAHVYTMRHCKPDMFEYQGESLFRHYCYYNYGCRLVGYTPICGCGPNAAILHYGHTGEPNARQIKDGDMCLFDMGAEYQGYGSDVTCSFPANGKFTSLQKDIYEGVLNAQKAVYAMMKPGVSWVDCHKTAEAAIVKQLVQIGLITLGDNEKTVEELVEMRMGSVFMPHGLGHFIGVDTHDVGGYLPGNPERISLPGLAKLRTARILQEDMVLTVEPGCYFINHLLDEALENPELSPYLNADLLASEQYRRFGGVRLEDVVAVTATGFINYTLCPRTVEEVENAMAGGKWPPVQDDAPELGRQRLTDPTPLPAPPSL